MSKPEPEAPELPELAPLPKDQRFSLAVIAGSQAGSVFPITKARIYLGRGSAMDVQIKDSEVSRRHAMLEVRKGAVVLVDLGCHQRHLGRRREGRGGRDSEPGRVHPRFDHPDADRDRRRRGITPA